LKKFCKILPHGIPAWSGIVVPYGSNNRTLAFCLSALVIGIDQITKYWVLETLVAPGTTLALPGPVDLTLVMNRSNAFGLVPVAGEISRWGLTMINVVVAAGLAVAIVTRPYRLLTSFGLAFIIAGAIGNAIDRARFGAVIDFIDASKLGFVWVFNVADAAIDVGGGLLILSWAIPEHSADKRHQPIEPDPAARK
jgi:signal peptidase II